MTSPHKATPLRSRTAPMARGLGWVVDGFRLFAAAPLPWLLLGLMLVVVGLLVMAVPLLGPLLGFLLLPVFYGGAMVAADHAVHGRPWSPTALLAGFGTHTRSLLGIGLVLMLLNLLALVVCGLLLYVTSSMDYLTKLATSEDMFAAALGLTMSVGLLAALGAYLVLSLPLVMLGWFAPALVMLEGQGTWAALGHSFTGCLRNMLPFLVYGLVGLVVFPLLVAVTFGLGMLVLVPVGLLSVHAAYRDIFHRP